MKVLYALHHPLDPGLGGAPSASIAIASEVAKLGHSVDFFSYDQAYGRVRATPSRLRLAFPWKLASFLLRHADEFDVLDITTGDAHIWATIGRLSRRRAPKIVTRSNGIEHLAHRALRARVKDGLAATSWRYPLYNGGLRLWEVRRSFRLSDGAVVLNEAERRFAVEELGAARDLTRVIGHGLDDQFLGLDPPARRENPTDGIARLCYIGNWLVHKGSAQVIGVAETLVHRGTQVALLIAGANRPPADVVAEFAAPVRASVQVVPRYERCRLPDLLAACDMLVFPSRFEGFSLALVEAMACGVIPIATPVGGAPDVIQHGVNGFLVGADRPEEIADIVESIARDAARRDAMRLAAYGSSKSYRWSDSARATLDLYEGVSRLP